MSQFGAGPSQPNSSESLFPGFPTLDVGRLISVVKKRLWLAALIACLFVGAAVFYVLTATKIYASYAVLYVPQKNEGAVFDGIKGAQVASWESLDALKSMAEGIQNGTVILRVANKLKLRENADFVKPKPGGYSDAEIVDYVGKRIYASLRRGTRLIDVGVKDKDPVLAQQMTQAFIDEFQGLIQEQNSSSAELAKNKLENEAAEQLGRVEEAEDKLQEFREANADVSFEDRGEHGTGTARKKLEELNRLTSIAVSERIARKSELDQLKSIPEGQEDRCLEIGEYGKQEHIQKLLTLREQAKTEFYKARGIWGWKLQIRNREE